MGRAGRAGSHHALDQRHGPAGNSKAFRVESHGEEAVLKGINEMTSGEVAGVAAALDEDGSLACCERLGHNLSRIPVT